MQIQRSTLAISKEPKAIGIDIGVRHFLTDSKGKQVENPKFYQNTLQTIKVMQY